MAEAKITQIFIKLLDNKTLTIQIPSQIPNPINSIKHQIQSLTQIPISLQTLIYNGKFLNPTTTTFIPDFSTLTLTLPLHGGKGGFGSLLRGAATKAGQKKTNNFDACRDMSGRRLRHVNAEKKLEEWKAEEEERKLEKLAEKYLKEVAKKKGVIGKREEKVEKYVQKYREESARCTEEVERSVREAAATAVSGKKRKVVEMMMKKKKSDVDAKKLKIWMGKRKLGESDSDDSDGDTESDDSDTENEKSVVINNGSQSDSSKDGTTGSASVSELDGVQGRGSSDSSSEEEKDTVAGGSEMSASVGKVQSDGDSPFEMSSEIGERVSEKQSISAEVTPVSDQINTDEQPSTSTLRVPNDAPLMVSDAKMQKDSGCKAASLEEDISGSSNTSDVSQPLNFDDINSAAELEALGMERLKSELQACGLKCGGTLQERATRLYLLKTTPLDKLPKKLLAKK